jgi:hypothetical protein
MRTKRGRLLSAAAVPSVFLIVAATVAGCSGSASSSLAGSGVSTPAAAAASAAGAAPAAAASASAAAPAAGAAASAQNGGISSGASSSAASSGAKYAPTSEQLVYTAQLTVRAPNVAAAVSHATSVVSAAGGYVSGENTSAGNGNLSQATATVTFKIPVTAYAATLAALSGGGLGTQLSLAEQAQDVTQQVADTSSRVASDEAAITQLRSLLAHAGDVSSLLTVQDQINAEESDLESMLAQQSALNHETAYGTVTVTVVGPAVTVKPKHPAKAAPPPGFARAISGGWHALHLVVSWVLTVLGAVVPFAAVVLVVGGLIWWGRRRVRRGR